MKPRHKRAAIVVGVLAAVGVAVSLVLNAFNSNLVFFYTPSQIASKEAPLGRTFRVGGLVQGDSVMRDGVTVRFTVTDTVNSVAVRYEGVLPDLFKEGKGVVAQGQLGADGVFAAREVLAKHDENYMPPEAAEALKQAGAMKGQPTLLRDAAALGATAGAVQGQTTLLRDGAAPDAMAGAVKGQTTPLRDGAAPGAAAGAVKDQTTPLRDGAAQPAAAGATTGTGAEAKK